MTLMPSANLASAKSSISALGSCKRNLVFVFFNPCLIDNVIFGPKGKWQMMNFDILFLTSFLKAR